MIKIDLPIGSVVSESVFVDQAGTEAAISGMYGGLYSASNSSIPTYGATVSLFNSLLADELTFNGTTYDQYANNSLISNEENVANLWTDSYATIYRANAIVEGVTASKFPTAFKERAIGEALFIRAFCYFYLVNLYGDVPLITTTVVQKNQLAPRAASSAVYGQITADLEQAVSFLPVLYPSGGNRTRVNKYAANALLARVYLYQRNYARAEASASEVISSPLYSPLSEDLSSTFLKSSTEAIWSFDTSVFGYTFIGGQTVPNDNVKPNYVIRPGLLNAFEANDKRKAKWVAVSVGDSYPSKYKTKTNVNLEYYVVLRLAEQYLIRSEARAQQDNFNGALADLNVIRNRAGLGSLSFSNRADILNAVAKERRVELFSEWGHRWLDLKRTGQVDAVIGALKPGMWQSTDSLYPIPDGERTKNTSLTQNPGYN